MLHVMRGLILCTHLNRISERLIKYSPPPEVLPCANNYGRFERTAVPSLEPAATPLC